MVENIIFFPIFYSSFKSLWFLQCNCISRCTARAWKQLYPCSFHTKNEFLPVCASYFKQHTTYYIHHPQFALGQTASSLMCLPLVVDTKPDSPHSSSLRKLTGSRPSVPLVSHGLKFFYNFPLFKGHSGLSAERMLISNIVSHIIKVQKKKKITKEIGKIFSSVFYNHVFWIIQIVPWLFFRHSLPAFWVF